MPQDNITTMFCGLCLLYFARFKDETFVKRSESREIILFTNKFIKLKVKEQNHE